VAARKRSRPGRPPGLVHPAAPARRERAFPAVAALLVLAAGAWAYSTSFGGVFVLDDVRAIVRNETIRSLWPLTTPLSPPAASTVAGRPVANLSFAVNHALAPVPAGERAAQPDAPLSAPPVGPAAFHAGNLIIHLGAALALFGIVRRTLQSPPLAARFGEPAPWLALAAALVWVVHPLTTAAVTYIVQRVESLMSLFYLLTLYCAIRASSAARAGWWIAAAIVSCALGMATKEVMVTAPVTVVIWRRLFAPPETGAARRRGIVLIAGLVATWAVLAFLVSGERRAPSLGVGWASSWSYLLAQAEVVLHYLRLAILPSPLVFLYDWPLGTSLGEVAWQAALLAAAVALTAYGVVRRYPASFLCAWFFLMLAPSSSVLPIVTEVAAEHRMYLPLAAVVTAAVVAAYLAGRRVARSPRTGLAAAAVAVAAAVGVLGAETRDRNRTYGSAEGLWRDTVTKRPNDARARVAYAEALAGVGKVADAEAQLRTSLSLAPGDAAARVRLGAVLAQQRKFDAAVPQLEQALTLRPGDPDAHRFLGEIYAMQRRDALAVLHYEEALAVVPGNAQLAGRLAAVLADSPDISVRNPARARALAGRAVELTNRRDPRLLEILSAAQAASGDFRDAAATARAAAAIARALGDSAAAASIDYRAAAYEQAARVR
jgi:Flp pilus assembly protein TadD